MSETPASSPIVIEKRDNGIVARVNVKLLEDKHLKMLIQMIDESAGDPDVSVVVIDLSKVQLVPSLGLGMLMQLSTKCKARQQRLKLAAMPVPVRQMFSITKLDRILELSDSVDAAME
ncbi:MAG: STAS domain-containing protein [Tepidisphaeraceae bacterium]